VTLRHSYRNLFLLATTLLAAQPSLTVVQQTAPQNQTPQVYQKWLDEDVHWITARDERAAFLKLSSNMERDKFVEQFWLRRDPTPGSSRNTFKEEHYRRIAYSNFHFSTPSLSGWKTDRGHVYILFGNPDSIEPHIANERSQQPPEESGQNEVYRFLIWRYRLMGVGTVELKFVDPCRCGEYRLCHDSAEFLDKFKPL
jgi:GWxTD domain-containing protein